jgi:purine nucleosidase
VADPLRLLIDTDPGVDDGVALVLALSHPGASVEAITVVRGNTGLAQTVRNACVAVEACGADVPVYSGADAPLVRPTVARPAWIHGADGFGDLGLRPAREQPDSGYAPERIVALLTAHPGQITVVTFGPLTNLALALEREAGIARLARGVVVMGGSAQGAGNVTPAAEFNVHADPEAARAVFRAGFRLTMVGIELSRGAARFTEEDHAAFDAVGSPRARLVAGLLGHSLGTAARRPMGAGERGAACPDAVAMAVALDPSLIADAVDAEIEVETRDGPSLGVTRIQPARRDTGAPRTRVVRQVDNARLKAFVRRVICER